LFAARMAEAAAPATRLRPRGICACIGEGRVKMRGHHWVRALRGLREPAYV
jgi:hypothetical protein